MAKLERARLIPVEPPKGADGQPKVLEKEAIEVCFNPNEYSLEKSVSWTSENARSDDPRAQFKSPSPMTLSVTLKFDTYEEKVSVRDKYVRHIEALTLMRGNPKDEQQALDEFSPLMVIFQWGSMTFQGVISSLSQKYTMFLSDGTPVRAECSIKITKAEKKEIDSTSKSTAQQGTDDYVTVNQGDRLDTIAARVYGDPTLWRAIADANQITADKPRDLTAGEQLKVPKDPKGGGGSMPSIG